MAVTEKRKSKCESSDDEDLVSRKAKVKQTKTPQKGKECNPKKEKERSPPKIAKKDPIKGKKEKAEGEEEEVYKWWEKKEQHPNGQQWLQLSHHGVLFPPEYSTHGVPLHYKMEDGTMKEIKMDPDEEEVATMFAVMRQQTRPPSDYYVNPTFRKNFFTDWLDILNSNAERNLRRFGTRQHIIKSLDRVNFDCIWQWHLEQKELKKAMTKEQKAAAKKARDEAEKANRFCIWDGKKQPVGNFRIEPPGLFRGRGKHPLMGKLKKRVQAEDIVINIGKEAKVPAPPPGRRWKEVRHDNKVTWLANWTDNVNGNGKYVMLAASSMVKGRSDHHKFEKARSLGEIIDVIREQYRKGWGSHDLAIQQRGVALYFIDVLALRCGHEKGEDEAETFGACSLKCEHINLAKENHVVFDFLGKDSIRYYNEVKVEPKVYSLLKSFVRGKTPNSDLFDRVRPEALNSHLKELMPGLSAKVFRTYNASFLLDKEFHEFPEAKNASLPEKIADFNAANTKVAILCNHQRSVGKAHEKAMVQFTDKLALLNDLLARLIAAKEMVMKDKKHGFAKAKLKWEADEHRQQVEWLEKFGTAEDRAQYDEKIAGKVTPNSPKTATKPGPTKKEPAPKRKVKEEDSGDDSDVPLSKKKKETPSKTAASAVKKPVKKEPAGKAKPTKVESDDDDSDIPLSKKRTMGKEKSPVKKPITPGKKRFESSDDEAPLPPAKKKKK